MIVFDTKKRRVVKTISAPGAHGVLAVPALGRVYVSATDDHELLTIDEQSGKVGFVLDLPSRGDTCFASVLPGAAPEQLVVYDYSSDIDGPEIPWTVGQHRSTFIYRHVLELARR